MSVIDKPVTRGGIVYCLFYLRSPRIRCTVTLTAKKLLQDLCREERLCWDNELPHRMHWEKWRNELPLLECLIVPRCVKPTEFAEVRPTQIHIFSDASTVAYGSGAYQPLCDNKGDIHCSFLMGKAHLAPIKVVTIPRLELTAATVSVCLSEILKKELDDKLETV